MTASPFFEAVATWARHAIVVFCVTVAAAFVLVATRRLWAASKAHLVVGAAAKLAFVASSFGGVIIVALAVCDLVVGSDGVAPLALAIDYLAAYAGALLGFTASVRLDAVTQALLPGGTKGAAALPPMMGVPVGAGLKKVAPAGGELCWVCGVVKTAPEHLAACPAAKGGAA